MSVIDIKKVKQEWVYFLRNSDIFTTTQRGVTTATDTGTFASDSSHIISVTNGKNVRSITVAGSLLTYGTDYDVNIDYDNSGTIALRITFNSAQTGDYSIPYDYGTDKIFPDFPRGEISISSFPRIGVGIVNVPTDPAGFGGVNVSKIGLTTVVYDKKVDDVNGYINDIRTAVFNAKSDFYYCGKLVQIISMGPVITSPFEQGKNKIVQQNIDVEGWFNYEK